MRTSGMQWLLTGLVLGSVLRLSAQWSTFPDSNASWQTNTYEFWTLTESTIHFFVEASNDTLINDTTFTKLYGVDALAPSTPDYCGGLFDNGAGQVFYHHPNSGITYLLYDFSLTEGDSASIAIGEVFDSQFYFQVLYVASVDTVVIEGQPRKRLGVQDHGAYVGGETVIHWWIEGIGGTGGLFLTSGTPVLDGLVVLNCMSANDTIWWGASGIGDCMDGLSVFENGTLHYDPWLHPSITDDLLFIDTPDDGAARSRIVSIDGRYCSAWQRTSGVLSVAHLPAGSYVLEWRNAAGTLRRGRFVKY